jgi:aminocarboxymuconate-semialdehyde decarboxylase
MPIPGDLLAGALAGIAFIGCGMTAAVPPPGSQPQAGGRRREVVVNGKRVKTVDVHAHCIVPAAAALIHHPLEAPGLLMHDTSTRIAAMDAQGIDVEALSINPYWYRAERDVAAELIKVQNETLVEFCAASPDRFVGFATAALQHPELAAESAWPAASPARNWPTRGSIRSGPSARNSAFSSSCTRLAHANWNRAAGSPAAGC